MLVVKSSIVVDMPQVDSRRFVAERHEFEDGSYEFVTYMAGPDDDVELLAAERAVSISESVDPPTPEPVFTKSQVEIAAKAVPGMTDSDIANVLEKLDHVANGATAVDEETAQ